MKIPTVFLFLLLGGSVSSAQVTTTVDPRHAPGTKAQPQGKPSDSMTIRPNKSAETSSAKEHAYNSFSDMSQSMPSEAVKNELVRKHALPGQQTQVLTPGDSAVTSVSSPSLNSATTGAAPRIETGSGMSIPQPTGGTSGVFK